MADYQARPLKDGTTVTTTRTVYNQSTRQTETRSRTFVLGEVDPNTGIIQLDRANEIFEHNGQKYSVEYIGPQRNF